MQRLALQHHGCPVAVVLAEDLESAEVDALVLATFILGFDYFAHALAAGVIDVKRLSTSTQINLLQLIFKVPNHLHAIYAGHATLNVIAKRIGVSVGLG